MRLGLKWRITQADVEKKVQCTLPTKRSNKYLVLLKEGAQVETRGLFGLLTMLKALHQKSLWVLDGVRPGAYGAIGSWQPAT